MSIGLGSGSFIQMSGMTLGGMIEADRRLREYEGWVRKRKRVERDQEVWRRWEGLVEGGRNGGEGDGTGGESGEGLGKGEERK